MNNAKRVGTILFVVGVVVAFFAGELRAQTWTPDQNPDWTLPVGSGMDTGPCEELGNPTLGKDKRITIKLN